MVRSIGYTLKEIETMDVRQFNTVYELEITQRRFKDEKLILNLAEMVAVSARATEDKKLNNYYNSYIRKLSDSLKKIIGLSDNRPSFFDVLKKSKKSRRF